MTARSRMTPSEARPIRSNEREPEVDPEAPIDEAGPDASPAAILPPARFGNPPDRLRRHQPAGGDFGRPGAVGLGPAGVAEEADGATAQPAVVLGIDPGFAGGLAFVGLGGEAVLVAPMPILAGPGKAELDVAGIVGLVRSVRADREVRLVVVERVHAMPRQGVASSFTFGRNFGEVLGAIKALGLPLELPTPQAWKKVVLAGTPGDKLAAVQYAARRFPAASLLATPRSRRPSDGIADALCLAEWGRRLVLGTMSDGIRGPAAGRKAPRRRTPPGPTS